MRRIFVLVITLVIVMAQVLTVNANVIEGNREDYIVIERLESEEVDNLDAITINEKTYGKEDNVKIHTLTVVLTAVPKSESSTRDYVPYHNYKWTRGNSYVQNTEIGYLHYRGRAKAMGNIYSGERVIQAKITYKRNGKVIKSGVSNAVFEANRWKAGALKTIYVNDSINPNAPQTKVYYNFITIDPHVTG